MIIAGQWDPSHNPPRPSIVARIVHRGRAHPYSIDFILDTASDRTIIARGDESSLRLSGDLFAREAAPVSTAFGEVHMKFVDNCCLEFYDIDDNKAHRTGDVSLHFLDERKPSSFQRLAARVAGIPFPPKRKQKHSILGRNVLSSYCLVATSNDNLLVLTDEHLELVDKIKGKFPTHWIDGPRRDA